MTRTRVVRTLVVLAIVLLGPLTSQAIFYGEDDYVEVAEVPVADDGVDWRETARSVCIVVDDPGDGQLDLSDVGTMRERYRNPPLEPTYPYGDQPRLANLTAFLVAPDKILTAGHAGRRQLENAAFLFDYTWDPKNDRLTKSRYKKAEIFRCKKILAWRNDKGGDYALCQLDRPVVGRKPLTVRSVGDASEIDRKAARMISAPDGTPLKLTANGSTLGKRPSKASPNLQLDAFFFHTLDNSGGSSGAPIFDAKTGHVIGIQSGGDDNFTKYDRLVHPVRGDFTKSNLGRPLSGEWGSLIPDRVVTLIEES